MSIFTPSLMREKLTDITVETFSQMGVTSVLLDVDNTLASYISHEPIANALAWAVQMQRAGLRLVIVSNNYKSRVAPFAAKFGLPYACFACKPLPFGYLKASRMLNEKVHNCAIVGDQIFTDVVGANLCGMKSILLEPVEPENGWLFQKRRNIEQKLRDKYSGRTNRT